MSAKFVLFVRKFAAFLDPPPPSERTSYMEAPATEIAHSPTMIAQGPSLRPNHFQTFTTDPAESRSIDRILNEQIPFCSH